MPRLAPEIAPPVRTHEQSDERMRHRAEHEIRRKYRSLFPAMDERQRRLWAGAEAESYGEGGITAVERATGLSRTTIRAGRDELRAGLDNTGIVHARRAGGGRPRLEDNDPGLAAALESLVDPVARGDSESPLRWTCHSTRALAHQLTLVGRPLSPQKVAQLLQSLGYALEATHRAVEDGGHSGRCARFEYIARRVDAALSRGTPVVSVAARKRLADGGDGEGDLHRLPTIGSQPPLRRHAVDPVLGASIPHRSFDLSETAAAPAVDAAQESAELAVDALAYWWRRMGRAALPGTTEVLLAVSGGRSGAQRPHMLGPELRRFASSTGLVIHVLHLPARHHEVEPRRATPRPSRRGAAAWRSGRRARGSDPAHRADSQRGAARGHPG